MTPRLAWAMSWGAPALLAALLLGALWVSRREWLGRPDRRALVGAGLLLGLGAFARLLVVPALAGHRYEGHEAEYYAIFLGERPLGEGSTALYPAMQAAWWALGRLLPHDPTVPVLLSVALGLAAGALLALGVSALAGPRAGWIAGALVALHPAHAAWSGSAYNVIGPNLLASLAFWATARLLVSEGGSRLAWVAGSALGLAVTCRMELVVAAAPLALLSLSRSGGARMLAPALVVGLSLGAAAVAPLLGEGMPGGGERGLALAMNAVWTAPYGAWGGAPGLLLLGVGGALAAWRWPARTSAILCGSLLGHLALATFDDLGERHALSLLPGQLWALAAGGAAFGARSALVPAVAGALAVAGLLDLRGRYEGSEEAFAAMLRGGVYEALPRRFVHAPPLPGRSPLDPDCGWVSEEPRVSSEPYASHFNLWDPAEAEALRGAGGCLHWCLDAADWRWSSRAVRDRAFRIDHLYELEPVAVVVEGSSGYACLVIAVGRRRCCGPGLPVHAPRLRARAPLP